MKVVGFSFSKLAAERIAQTNIKSPPEVGIDFINIEKEPNPLFKDSEIAKVSFCYKINYQDNHDSKKPILLGNVTLEGFILVSLDKTEYKELEKEKYHSNPSVDSLKVLSINGFHQSFIKNRIESFEDITILIGCALIFI